MRPATQGTFDGLCGVYALLNALDPAGLRLARSKLHRDLFVKLTHALSASRLRAAMHGGLTHIDLQVAGKLAFYWLREVHGVTLVVDRPFSRCRFANLEAYFACLNETIGNGGGVIIRFRTSSMSHWTVVSAVSPRTLHLRDSLGWRQIRTSKFEMKAYRIYPADTLVVRQVTPG
jgi:hypothetical protein